MAVNDQTYGTIQEGLVLFDRKRLLIQDRVISGGACQFHDGEEHYVNILVFIFVLTDHLKECLIEIIVRAFSGQKYGA